MEPQLESIVIGTLGLDVLLAMAAYQTLARTPQWQTDPGRLTAITLVAIGCHIAHSLEEWHFEFYISFPALLGLVPWPEAFFVTFNSVWVLLWCLSIPAIYRRMRVALLPLWFLALASVANGLFHPTVSLLQMGYFPGLATAMPVGIAGFCLLLALLQFTGSKNAEAR